MLTEDNNSFKSIVKILMNGEASFREITELFLNFRFSREQIIYLLDSVVMNSEVSISFRFRVIASILKYQYLGDDKDLIDLLKSTYNSEFYEINHYPPFSSYTCRNFSLPSSRSSSLSLLRSLLTEKEKDTIIGGDSLELWKYSRTDSTSETETGMFVPKSIFRMYRESADIEEKFCYFIPFDSILSLEVIYPTSIPGINFSMNLVTVHIAYIKKGIKLLDKNLWRELVI